MNAAFLLVTTAVLGQVVEAKPAAPAPAAAPVVASACGPNCGSDACGCEGFGHRLREKMHGLFQRGCRDTCQPTCCTTNNNCGGGHGHKFFRGNSCDNSCCQTKTWTWQPRCRQHCHKATTCCDPCNQGGVNFLGRLRGIFHRGDRCCDGGCSTGCAGGACGPTAAPAPGGEKIEAPKKMPPPPKDGKQEVLFQTQPSAVPPIANAPGTIPSAPNVEIAPNPAPRVDGDRRDPF